MLVAGRIVWRRRIVPAVGPGGFGYCLRPAPEDLNCVGFTPCTWNDRAQGSGRIAQLPCQPGYVCIVTGFCSGPEEVCLPVISPT